MATLTTIPEDLKFLILSGLADFDSLLSLILASRDYWQVYCRYRKSIDQAVLCNEVELFKEEAYFIAVYKDALLYKHEYTRDQVNTPVVKYIGALRNQQQQMRYSAKFNLPESKKHILKSNHKVIRSSAALLIRRKLYLDHKKAYREGASSRDAELARPTGQEIHRVILALYRLWVVLLLYRARGGGSLPVWQYDINAMAKIFDSWEFWEFVDVKTVASFYWDQFLPYLKMTNAISRLRGNPREWKYECGSHEPRSVQYATIMGREFPMNINHWVQNNDKPEAQLRKLNELKRRYRAAQANTNSTSRRHATLVTPGVQRLFCLHLRGELTTSRPVMNLPGWEAPSIAQKRTASRLRPLCRPGAQWFDEDEQVGGARSWLDLGLDPGRQKAWDNRVCSLSPPSCYYRVDLRLSIWDDNRLWKWGYLFPQFGARNISATGSLGKSFGRISKVAKRIVHVSQER